MITSLKSSLEIELQAFDRGILLPTPSRGLSGSLGRNQGTFQRPFSIRFLGCDRTALAPSTHYSNIIYVK